MNDDYRPNIYARLQLPWVLVMWGFLAVGLCLIFLQVDALFKIVGFGILALCMFMLIVWATRINPRAAIITKKKEQPKRKNKHPVYRKSEY